MVGNWQPLARRELARSGFYTFFEEDVLHSSGRTIRWSRMSLPDFSAVVVVTPEKDIVMVSNYRYPTGEFISEIPAGLIDPGESPEEAAWREVEEETGYVGESLSPLGTYHPNANLSSQRGHIFLMTGATRRSDPHLDTTEELEMFIEPISRVIERILAGYYTHPPTVMGVMMAARILDDPDVRGENGK